MWGDILLSGSGSPPLPLPSISSSAPLNKRHVSYLKFKGQDYIILTNSITIVKSTNFRKLLSKFGKKYNILHTKFNIY